MLKIAFLIDTISCDTAGTQKQLLETIRRLDRQYFEPYLLCLRQSEWMKNNPLPCTCIVLGYQGFLQWNFSGVVKKLGHIICELRIDLIQTFFEDSIFVGFFGKLVARKPVILLSSRRDMGLGKENQPWYHSLFTLALPSVNRYFDAIIANSEQVRVYVAAREKTDPGKIKVIYNGVAIPDKPSAIPAVLQPGNEPLLWLCMVASLTPVKRHDLLLEAVLLLSKQDHLPPFKVLLLGEGAQDKYLQDRINELEIEKYIHFAGAVKNVAAYLYHVDIGVLCSDREGLSNAILEYMACGLPVVATAVGGNIELVDKSNGFCVPAGDAESLAAASGQLLTNSGLRREMGRASLCKIQQCYSWDNAMKTLEDYYRHLAGTKK